MEFFKVSIIAVTSIFILSACDSPSADKIKENHKMTYQECHDRFMDDAYKKYNEEGAPPVTNGTLLNAEYYCSNSHDVLAASPSQTANMVSNSSNKPLSNANNEFNRAVSRLSIKAIHNENMLMYDSEPELERIVEACINREFERFNGAKKKFITAKFASEATKKKQAETSESLTKKEIIVYLEFEKKLENTMKCIIASI